MFRRKLLFGDRLLELFVTFLLLEELYDFFELLLTLGVVQSIFSSFHLFGLWLVNILQIVVQWFLVLFLI